MLLQPLFSIRLLGLGEHRVGQIDADDPAVGTDRLLDQREVQTGAAGDVDHGVAGAKPECLYGPAALGPLRVAGHGVEPGDDVVVLRLLAVGLDQVLSRTVESRLTVCLLERMRWGATPIWESEPPAVGDSTAALIAAISTSITR